MRGFIAHFTFIAVIGGAIYVFCAVRVWACRQLHPAASVIACALH
jgi:hypothetical protein